jgi:choline dehydrogenase-like flavoprotein
MHLTRGLSLHVCNLRPESRGVVRLAANTIRKPPVIDPGYLSHPGDLDRLVAGVRIAQRILAAPAFARYAGKTFHNADSADENLLRESIRQHADTIYHPVGTCRMGSDATAPVDPQLRVRGVSRLRVADASIMPTLISGNTQAPSAMIGERAADFLIA